MKRSTFFLVFLSLLIPVEVVGLGLYEDYGSYSILLTSPFAPSLGAAIIRSEKSDHDASGFLMKAVYPSRRRFLLQVEVSYYVVSRKGESTSGFGDFVLSGRTELARLSSLTIDFVAGLRTGSGTASVFPYASGSVDVKAGLAFVDSLAQLTLWGEAAGVSVNRMHEGSNRAERHDDFASAVMGFSLPVGKRVDLRFGGAAYIVLSGGSREIYFAVLNYAHSPRVHVILSFQAEGGEPAERVYDMGVRGGVDVFY